MRDKNLEVYLKLLDPSPSVATAVSDPGRRAPFNLGSKRRIALKAFSLIQLSTILFQNVLVVSNMKRSDF